MSSTAVKPEVMDDEESEGHEILETTDALMAINASEINAQVTTAKKYPRSIKRFQNSVREMACLNEDVASECMYSLRRGGKTIEGPSARFAEIVASAWGNCRVGARIVAEDERFVTAQGAFMDLQNNVAITYETKRRITDKNGNTYSDDMIGVTANAACSIALRNAVFKGIPKALWKPVYDEARQTAVGDATTLATRRDKMMGYFVKLGASPEQVFALLEVKGIEDITLEHLAILKGVATAIKEGDSTVDQAFGAKPATGAKAKRSTLNDEPAEKKAAETPASDLREGSQVFRDLSAKLDEAIAAGDLKAARRVYDDACGGDTALQDEAEIQRISNRYELFVAGAKAEAQGKKK